MSVFAIENNGFLLDGKPFRILSGSIHYFRVLPEYWEDRLRKLAACGFNTVETYVPWNLHEIREGQFDFSGILDIERFLTLAGALGLKAIVRPSPYICAEWEFGGLPAWLLNTGAALRCADPVYLEKVGKYYDELIPRLAKLQCTRGGPLVLLQIENEYGSYGNDKTYLRFLEQSMRRNGIEVPLFTSDGGCDLMLSGGTLPDIYKTVNFGSRPDENFNWLQKYQPDKPLMCAEFWNGWFDHWTEEHHTRDGDNVADCLREMLRMGASVNFYMFHGGTNFGFTSGANCPGEKQYQPTVTSYDYDCPLTEEGHITQKYLDCQAVLAEFGYKNDTALLPEIPVRAFGEVRFTQSATLRSQIGRLASHHYSASVKPMEAFGQNYGLIRYTARVAKLGVDTITLRDVHDRAKLWVNNEYIGTLYRNDKTTKLVADFHLAENTLEILVENMGRVNYGAFLADRKGITQDVSIGQQFQSGWEVDCMELDNIDAVQFENQAEAVNEPTFLRATVSVDVPADTYFRGDAFHKGMVWINGFNIGRYWNDAGPQKTLYIPAALLHEGENEIIVLEMDSADSLTAILTDTRDLG